MDARCENKKKTKTKIIPLNEREKNRIKKIVTNVEIPKSNCYSSGADLVFMSTFEQPFAI